MKKLAIILVLLAGCEFQPTGQSVGSFSTDNKNEVKKVGELGYNDVYDFTTTSGVRCIALSAYRGGGLSCNFTKERK